MKNSKIKILETTLDLLQERGINGFSLSDVAKIVGIKKASIFYYFSTKLDLVKAVLEYYQTNFFSALNETSKENESLRMVLIGYSEIYKINLEKNNWVCLCSMLATESFSLDSQLKQSVNDFFNNNIEWIQNQLLKFGFSQADAFAKANQLFITIQGAQIITQSLEDIHYFEKAVLNEIETICSMILPDCQ